MAALVRRGTVLLVAVTLAGVMAAPPAGATTLYAGAFLSSPHQPGRQSVSGNDVVVHNKSWVGFTGGACLTVGPAHNVDLVGLDFDGCGGGLYLHDVTGTIHIEGIRCRNTGNGNIGSGQGNCIQFSRSWQGALGGVQHCGGCATEGYALVRSIKALGGDTEDMISVYQSGGVDAQHPLVIGDVHLESPLPPDPLAWSSSSGTCVNLGDSSGHDIRYQNSTALNCGQVGEQINKCNGDTNSNTGGCRITRTTVYGAQRAGSNVGISRYGSCTCSGNVIDHNRVWWKNASGSLNNAYGTSNPDTTWTANTFGDTTINPANLAVKL